VTVVLTSLTRKLSNTKLPCSPSQPRKNVRPESDSESSSSSSESDSSKLSSESSSEDEKPYTKIVV